MKSLVSAETYRRPYTSPSTGASGQKNGRAPLCREANRSRGWGADSPSCNGEGAFHQYHRGGNLSFYGSYRLQVEKTWP